jgi:ribosome-associated toxin RatA of RatAB toxin-antitoxin module
VDRTNRWARGAAAASLLALGVLAPGAAVADGDPKVDIKTFAVPGSDTPKVVATATLDVPPKKLWAIISDCEHYKGRMPRVVASKLLKKEGNVHTCEVTIEMPFPLSNLTAVTESVHEESDKGMARRWKLVRGDYKTNTGSWEIKPADASGTSSIVTYTVHAEPNTIVPAAIREAAQKKTLPEMFAKVRNEAAKLP